MERHYSSGKQVDGFEHARQRQQSSCSRTGDLLSLKLMRKEGGFGIDSRLNLDDAIVAVNIFDYYEID